MFALSLMVAWACPPSAGQVAEARLAFEDAELETAATVLQQAVRDLACQTEVVETEVLLELFRLDALVALSVMDNKAATYSTIRAVVIDPSMAPPAEYGPQLGRLHATWSERLRSATAELTVRGEGQVWLDGQPLNHGARVTVPQGEHLVQIRTTTFSSMVQDVTADGILDTGVPVSQPQPLADPIVDPPYLVDPLRIERPEPTRATARRRRRPAALWVVGGVLAASGVGVVGWGAAQERTFKESRFADDDEVDRAASRIRVTYGTGYGLGGVGGVLLLTNAIGFPGAQLTGRF